MGRIVEVDHIRLHLLDRGPVADRGRPPVVVLHGNGSLIQDPLSSGLVDQLAQEHRVIVFDRPGYGHSERPRGRAWTPEAQAEQRIKDILRAAESWSREAPGALTPAIRAVCIRLAEMVARDLHASLRYTWWPQHRGFLRNTLKAGTCDVVMGLPSSVELAATTRPYYRSTYVFVYRKDRGIAVKSFDDPVLRKLKIGVQMVGNDATNTPPAHALSSRGIIGNVRGYMLYGDYSKPNPPADIVRAVERYATVLIVAPIAVAMANESGVALAPVLMLVAVAGAASFLTPIATPANMMVMGAGGYRFSDYWKLGLVTTLAWFVVAVLLIPVIWPT